MTFKKGEEWNGNRAGRPAGTGHRQQAFNGLVMPHREALLGKAIQMALDGNESMLKLFIERLLPPKPIDEPMYIDTPNNLNFETCTLIAQQILNQVGNGEITPKEAHAYFQIVNQFQQNIASQDLLDSIRALATQVNKLKTGESFNG